MKKIIYVIMICMLLVVSVTPLAASAVESTLSEEEAQRNIEKINMVKERVYDNADLLTDEEEADLEIILMEQGILAEADIVFVTTNDMENKSDKVYLEDFHTTLHVTEDSLAENSALMLINMQDRVITLQGYGDCEFWLNNDRIEYMLDDIYVYVTEQDYYGAVLSFANQTVYYMGEDAGVSTEYETGEDYGEAHDGTTNYYTPEISDHYSLLEYIAIQLSGSIFTYFILSIIFSTIVCVIIGVRRKTRVTVIPETYMDRENSGFSVKRDDYLRTTLTKVRRPTESSKGSSGGFRSSGGGGRSSSGHSHSGGSRRF